MALFEPVFDALGAAGVRYVVVDDVAVVLHGHPRLTADLDIAVDLAPQAAAAAMAALEALGLRPLLSVDLFVENPIDFEELWERSEVVELGDSQPRVASIADLIRLKHLADRPQISRISKRSKRSTRHVRNDDQRQRATTGRVGGPPKHADRVRPGGHPA